MRGIRLLAFVLISITIIGCSNFRKIQRKGDWNAKYEAAVEYFNEEDYNKSILLLEEIQPIIRGSEKAEMAAYYLAYSYFHERQYILSAYQFEEFARIYGRSEYLMEATYMHAYSLYLQSPDYQLDQTSTYEAIGRMQSFLDRYPDSEYSEEASDVIDEMQVKLERKAYENCRLYYKLRRYKAALVVFDNFKKDFPDSKFNEEIAFLKVEVSYDLARQSIYTVQEERFKQTADLYINFIDKYPSSEYLKAAEKIYADCLEQITIFADSKK